MRRIRVCQAELERLLLGRLRAKPDCQGVKDITIRAIDHGDADWQVVAIDYGTAEGVTCATTLEQIVRSVRQRYQLVPLENPMNA